jgi:2'-5' RNA ligase
MTERWRCFVAVPIGERLRTDLALAVGQWRNRSDLEGLRWTDPDGWHVTLAFLGSIARSSLPGVVAAIAGAAGSHQPLSTPTGGLGAFPAAARARIGWYGVADADGRLTALAVDIAHALELDVGGPFHPHVTLARARRAPVDMRDWLTSASAPEGDLVVDSVSVMRSHTGRGPARYETLASIQLGVHARV